MMYIQTDRDSTSLKTRPPNYCEGNFKLLYQSAGWRYALLQAAAVTSEQAAARSLLQSTGIVTKKNHIITIVSKQ